MAIQVNIEKNFKGFSLKSVFESNTSATGILGASGSGKSMTLRCSAGIETPDRGKIVINGRTVFDSEKKINLKPQERRIGYLFQNYALFPTMTVKENAQKYFERYNKLKRTFEALSTLTVETENELAHLESIMTSIDIAASDVDLDEIRRELGESGYIKSHGPKGRKDNRRKCVPYHYLSSDGFDIYVGKNNYQNEELDFKFANGGDWWFHAKGIPGSHVQGVVRPVLERYGTGDNVAGQRNGFNPFRSRENNGVIVQEGSIRLASISTLVPARSSVAPGTGSGIPDKRFHIVACSLILHGHAGTVGDKHEIAGSQLVGGIDSRQCLIGVLPGLLPNKKGIQGSPQISPGGHEIAGQQGIVHQLAVGNRQRFHGARNHYLYIPRPVILGHCSGI